MINNRNFKFRIATNEKSFNNTQIILKFYTKIQQENNNVIENILSRIESSKFIEFVYDFAIDRFENFDDDVSTNFKFQYLVRFKIYVT